MIWLGILVGSAMRSVEAVNGVMFTTIFPLTFLSNAFAPTEPMGPVLRTDRRVEPDLGAGAGDPRAVGQHRRPHPPDAALPLQYPVIATLIWCVALTAILAPLSIRTFRNRTQQ